MLNGLEEGSFSTIILSVNFAMVSLFTGEEAQLYIGTQKEVWKSIITYTQVNGAHKE